MSTIRKISFLVILFLLSLNLLTAETEVSKRDYRFSITPLAGVLVGQLEEILYKYDNSDQYVSELLWDLKPLVYIGLHADFGPGEPFKRSGFTASASIKFGLPLRTGSMEDRDWLDSRYDYLTNYSWHEAYAQNAILADVSAGYSWSIRDFFVISVFAEFSYMYFSLMAENGYAQYAHWYGGNIYDEWDAGIEKKPIFGPGIRYIQNWFILSPGISLDIKINDYFSLGGVFNYSPLIYSMDRDDHFFRDLLYYGYFFLGHYVNGGINFCYSPSKNIELSLSVSYRYITGLRDKSYVANTGGNLNAAFSENYEGGMGYSVLDIKLAARIQIPGR